MKKLFRYRAQFVKVDEATRTVAGIATAEVLDKSGEIMDYETSVPFFKSWSDDIASISGGKSVGNLREMHTNIAAGAIKTIEFDDVAKVIRISAEIVDDSTWQKVQKGVLNGFSIGGEYVKRWKDAAVKAMRFTAKPVEISVVDNPCVGVATFEYAKADGSVEQRKVNSVAKEFMTKVRELSNAAQLGVTLTPEEITKTLSHVQDLNKSMYDVGELAYCISCLNNIRLYLTSEAEWEGDGSPIPGQLLEAVKTLSAILIDLAAEETSELTPDKTGAILTASTQAVTAKAVEIPAATPAASEDEMNEQAIKDLMKASGETLEKFVSDKLTAMQKAFDEKLDAMQKAYDVKLKEVSDAAEGALKGIQTIGKALAPTTVAVSAQTVTKAADSGNTPAVVVDDKDPLAKLKAVHASGGQPLMESARGSA